MHLIAPEVMKFVGLLILSLTFVKFGNAWTNGIVDTRVCNTFHVSHGNPQNRDLLPPTALEVNLLNSDGDIVNCVEPRQIYTLQLRSNITKDIKGFLVVQALKGDEPKKTINRFPLENIFPESNKVRAACTDHTVSHKCISDDGCSFGKVLEFGYKSPERVRNNLVFRYVVVFTKYEYLENQTRTFPVCEPKPQVVENDCTKEAHDTNLAGESTLLCSNFTVKNGTEKKTGNCGKMSYPSNATHIYTDKEKNINYTCHTSTPIRKTECTPTCPMENGEEWCCKIGIMRNRTRTFECYADPELNSAPVEVPKNLLMIRRTAKALQTKKCDCYPCSEIIYEDACCQTT